MKEKINIILFKIYIVFMVIKLILEAFLVLLPYWWGLKFSFCMMKFDIVGLFGYGVLLMIYGIIWLYVHYVTYIDEDGCKRTRRVR